jgi:hypothetical protein
MKKITGFICASVAVLALSGCSPSSADLEAGAVLQCQNAQFIIASGNEWLEKKPELITNLKRQVERKTLTQEQADQQLLDFMFGYVELAKGLGLAGDGSGKVSEPFARVTEQYRGAISGDTSIIDNPYLEDVLAQCESVGVLIDPKSADADKYRGQ